MHRSSMPQSTIRKIVTLLVLYSFVAGVAILYGESQESEPYYAFGDLEPEEEIRGVSGQERCHRCGGELHMLIDQSAACRHCTTCNVTFRHSALPMTLKLQQQIYQ